MTWTARTWTGRHLSHASWHWVWLSFGDTHKHGYGPSYEEALANAHAAPPYKNGEIDTMVGFRRRV